jgi:hypothetical protein
MIILFGQAERGRMVTAYPCSTLERLFELFGEPPEGTKGLFFAIQTLLYHEPLLYFRVTEEGISLDEYLHGLQLICQPHFPLQEFRALFLPGVNADCVLEEGYKVCRSKQGLLLVDEADFYDILN